LLSGKFSRTNQKAADSRRTDYDFPIVDKERTWTILDVMAPIAKANGCSPARVTLARLLAKPVVTSVIIGAKRLARILQRADSAALMGHEHCFDLNQVNLLIRVQMWTTS
jgi:aryl-alcohol dehydrogenase-like predicted oxidoreductase